LLKANSQKVSSRGVSLKFKPKLNAKKELNLLGIFFPKVEQKSQTPLQCQRNSDLDKASATLSHGKVSELITNISCKRATKSLTWFWSKKIKVFFVLLGFFCN